MPRVYKRKPGSRRYVDYTKEQLEECLNAIRSKRLTQREAAKKYNIPRSTIKNKLKNKTSRKHGRPTVFTTLEEMNFVAHVTALAEYGFPLEESDLIFVIKDYLSSQGRIVKEFTNNTPGREWVRSFLKRHEELSKRFANNIKRVRAQVSEQVIEEFIDNLTPILESIPPENIYNYDESNLTDDPGKKTVICKRGAKYPERIVNSTKLSYSAMFCGNAAGEVIPPYIIYKADNLWSTWMENGPEGARYNRTKSGWMDANTFEDWFICHLLPYLKKKEGHKVVIGDNLSSHINKRVLSECEKNDISFICLPPNSTHILQPLDVAYFRPLKIKWRQILTQWKDSQKGRKLPTTPKEIFPNLLKKALDSMTETRENLIAGFRRSGIYPLNKEEPLKRLPRQDRIVRPELIADSFLQKLDHLRSDHQPVANKNKKKKLNVPPGKSICVKDIEESGPSSLAIASSSGVSKPIAKKMTRGKRPRSVSIGDSSSTTDCSGQMSLASSTEDLIIEDSDEDLPLSSYKPSHENQQTGNGTSKYTNRNNHNDRQLCCNDDEQKLPLKWKDYNVDDYVLVKWSSQIYPGQITSISEEGAMVSCMKKGKSYWRWPSYKDEQLYSWNYILNKIMVPKFTTKGNFTIPELDDTQTH